MQVYNNIRSFPRPGFRDQHQKRPVTNESPILISYMFTTAPQHSELDAVVRHRQTHVQPRSNRNTAKHRRKNYRKEKLRTIALVWVLVPAYLRCWFLPGVFDKRGRPYTDISVRVAEAWEDCPQRRELENAVQSIERSGSPHVDLAGFFRRASSRIATERAGTRMLNSVFGLEARSEQAHEAFKAWSEDSGLDLPRRWTRPTAIRPNKRRRLDDNPSNTREPSPSSDGPSRSPHAPSDRHSQSRHTSSNEDSHGSLSDWPSPSSGSSTDATSFDEDVQCTPSPTQQSEPTSDEDDWSDGASNVEDDTDEAHTSNMELSSEPGDNINVYHAPNNNRGPSPELGQLIDQNSTANKEVEPEVRADSVTAKLSFPVDSSVKEQQKSWDAILGSINFGCMLVAAGEGREGAWYEKWKTDLNLSLDFDNPQQRALLPLIIKMISEHE